MLDNFSNYFKFEPLVRTGNLTLYTEEINHSNWKEYYYGCYNIMRDGIETTFIQKSKVDIVFPDGMQCKLTIPDLYFNLIMWYMIIEANRTVDSEHLFFDENITKDSIKNYVDTNFILPNRETIDFTLMNNIIDDTLHRYMDIDEFSLFLGSTVNLEDFVNLSIASPRFNEIMHADLTGVPIEKVKDYGMELTYEAIDIIKNSANIMGYEHCLADSFRSKEGTNIKQFKEFAVSIGSKPDGKGGAYPVAVNNSYLNGGLNQIMYQFIDSSASRFAQIIAKNNVGDSGNFARILGLNSIDSILNEDSEYSCQTKNFLEVNITSVEVLKKFKDRWYRIDKHGIERCLTGRETWLIGHTIYLRSPIFCESAAKGNGICFRCYGKLAFINRYINVGKMAAELITAIFTQTRLSAKHLLETMIKEYIWNQHFYTFMNVDANLILLNPEFGMSLEWNLMIHKDDIILENDEDYDKSDYDEDSINRSSDDDEEEESANDDTNYNEYITQFYVKNSNTGEMYKICGEEEPYRLYISNSLNSLIRKAAVPTEDGYISLSFDDIQDTGLFFIKIENNDLGKSLDDIKNLMDKQDVTSSHTIHSLTQAIIDAVIEGRIGVQMIHFEILLMNQVRSVSTNLKRPEWQYEDEPYVILTLKKALTDNPSIVISLLYQNLGHTLYYPLSFQKNAPSFMDVFFMRQPQNFMDDDSNLISTEVKPTMRTPVMRMRRGK